MGPTTFFFPKMPTPQNLKRSMIVNNRLTARTQLPYTVRAHSAPINVRNRLDNPVGMTASEKKYKKKKLFPTDRRDPCYFCHVTLTTTFCFCLTHRLILET